MNAESALETARQRLENVQRKHQERLVAVCAEEAALIAPAPKVPDASLNDVVTKAQRVLSWIDSIAGTRKLLNVQPSFMEAVFAMQSSVLAVQPGLKPSIYNALEPTTDAPDNQDPSMSQFINSVLSGTDVAVTDMNADGELLHPFQCLRYTVVATP